MDTIEAVVFITGPFLLICKNIGRTSMNVNLFKKKSQLIVVILLNTKYGITLIMVMVSLSELPTQS